MVKPFFFFTGHFKNAFFFFFYRLCKNIYRLHVVFVFLTSFPIYDNYNRSLINTKQVF